MNRLRVPAADIAGPTVTVHGEPVAYLRDVLRLRPGAPLEVFDGEGGTYAATLVRFGDDSAELELGAREERPFRGVKVTLLQGLPKGDKFELIVQKAVELGASAVVPVATERSIVKLDERKAAERVVRWQRIADEAARQCGRADLLVVGPVATLREVLARPPAQGERRLLLDEEERSRRLRDVLVPAPAYSILIGPEGGITREEAAAARAAGFVGVTLGPRILRTETAPLAMLSVLQFALGDLG